MHLNRKLNSKSRLLAYTNVYAKERVVSLREENCFIGVESHGNNLMCSEILKHTKSWLGVNQN